MPRESASGINDSVSATQPSPILLNVRWGLSFKNYLHSIKLRVYSFYFITNLIDMEIDHDAKIDRDQELKDEMSEALASLDKVADDIEEFEEQALTY